MTHNYTLSGSYTPLTHSNNSKDVTVCVGLVVDAVLDEEKLLRGAYELVRKWPVLGGSIDKSTKPWSLTTGYKLDFRCRKWNQKIREVFAVPLELREKNGPSYYPVPGDDDWEKLFHFDDFGGYDTLNGLLSMRVTILRDATLLGFRASHFLVNALALQQIIAAYGSLLRGEEIEDLVWPPDHNPATPLSSLITLSGEQEREVEELKKRDAYAVAEECYRVGIWKGLRMVLTMIWSCVLSWLFRRWGIEQRVVFLSGECVERWRVEAEKELRKEGKGEDEEVRLSRLDVVTAWWLKTTYAAMKPDPHPFAAFYPMSYRNYLPPSKSGTTYIKNTGYEMLLYWRSFSAFQRSSLATIAKSIRQRVLAAKHPAIVKESLIFLEKERASFVTPGMRDGGNMFGRMPIVSSWGEGLGGLDFGGAVKDGAEKGQGKVLFVLPRNLFPGGLESKGLVFVVRDERLNGYWLRAWLGRKEWEGHDRERRMRD